MTVYSIMINLVQSLQVVRADHEPSATALKALLDKASQEEVLSKFGLSRAYTTSDYIATDVSADQISIPALEGITEYLLEVLTHGAGGTGAFSIKSFVLNFLRHYRPIECLEGPLDESRFFHSVPNLPLYSISSLCDHGIIGSLWSIGNGR